MKLELLWKFCPECGALNTRPAIEAEVVGQPEIQIEAIEHEKAPVKGAFGGLLYGMLAMPILIIVGTMLCLTGLGAILGIPMILVAVLSPLAGPMLGLGTVTGKCPWCGSSVSGMENAKDFSCLSCSQRIAIRHREFVKAG